MKPLTRHKRRIIRYRRRGQTVFGTLRRTDRSGYHSYSLVPVPHANYPNWVVDSLSSWWVRNQAQMTKKYWPDSLRSAYEGLTIELGDVLDAEAGLRAALASATPKIIHLADTLASPCVDEFPTHLDELGAFSEHHYFEPPQTDEGTNLYGDQGWEEL